MSKKVEFAIGIVASLAVMALVVLIAPHAGSW